jgi:hypothetical protein
VSRYRRSCCRDCIIGVSSNCYIATFLASPEGQEIIGEMYTALANTANAIGEYINNQEKARSLIVDYVNNIVELVMSLNIAIILFMF